MILHAFGRSTPWSVGVEEELFVVDRETLAPAPVPPEALDGRRLKPELFAAVLELNTEPCTTVAEAADQLAQLRAEARRRAGEARFAVAACATWPTARPEDQEITSDEGYLRFVEYAGPSARRQLCSGLHVHVGVESPEACMAALEAVLPWLPLVLALSANSPYVASEETGLASTRAEILSLLPRAGAPPVFESYRDWGRFAETLVRLELADQITRIWWDVRPHPRFGTLELRMPDQPTRLEVTIAFAALLQALVAGVRPGPSADRGFYAQNRWAALRFGHAARLVHPDGDRLCSVEELFDELTARLAPTFDELGTAALLEPLRGLDQAGAQLELGRREGLEALCRSLVNLT
ncbi:MAG TPA: YbdK family carboxylate-amine ligase [Gaiellaceae bacterium]|nr:YbdK family carboxylate-amine ligase [Gaiellaceae bacterium]